MKRILGTWGCWFQCKGRDNRSWGPACSRDRLEISVRHHIRRDVRGSEMIQRRLINVANSNV